MLNRFKKFVETEALLTKGTKVLLACSGGVDSMVLAHLLKQANYELIIAHCNFNLRGAESDEDENFIREYADRVKIVCEVKQFDTQLQSLKNGESIQMIARRLRYEWLEEIRLKHGCHSLLTAHHLNDSAETVLLNLTKGTGISGLHGILPKTNGIVRPLLFATKAEILDFAKKEDIDFREDASNFTTKYQRNKIRLDVIPKLLEINPSFIKGFQDQQRRFIETEHLFKVGLNHWIKKIKRSSDKAPGKYELSIPIRLIQKSPAPISILYYLLEDYGFSESQIKQIYDSANAVSGKQFIGGNKEFKVIKNRKHFILTKAEEQEAKIFTIDSFNFNLKLKEGQIVGSIKKNNGEFEAIKNIAYLNPSKLEMPIRLRRWKHSDYFYPFGMNLKKKKLSKFFIDLKLSLDQKKSVWILEDAKDRIVYILGLRSDERFKVNLNDKELLLINWDEN